MPPCRGPELTEADRGGIIALQKAKKTYAEISELMDGIPVSTVCRTIQRYNKYNTVKSLPRSGRPRILNPHKEARILQLIKANRKASFRTIAEQTGFTTARQVARVAERAGYHRRIARRKPFVSEATRTKRIQWAHANTGRNWHGVLWSDEVGLGTGNQPKRQMVTR